MIDVIDGCITLKNQQMYPIVSGA